MNVKLIFITLCLALTVLLGWTIHAQSLWRRILMIAKREIRTFSLRPVFLFCVIVAPLLCIFFFTSLMSDGLPKQLPAAIVDEDNTHISRQVCRILDTFEMTDISLKFHSYSEAHRAMQKGQIYAFFYLPKGFTREALSGKQPRISYYTNDAYYVPANLLMKDMKTASELMGLALTREKLYARGATERQAMGVIQPIKIETHPLGNATLDYSVYLSNMLVPGIFILLILLSTTYTIGFEWKQRTQRLWYAMADGRVGVALLGKLLPQFLVFAFLMIFMDVWFYGYMGFPCHCGLTVMFALSVLTVLSSQCFGVFLFGIMAGRMRLAMCICSLWGILSFSLAGFTYPVSAMSPVLRCLSWLFPLRHYYLIYVNQALNGYSLNQVWPSVATLMLFCLLPVYVQHRYRKAFLLFKYQE